MQGEGRGLSSRQTQDVVRDREIGQPSNSEKRSETADGVTRESEGRGQLSLLDQEDQCDARVASTFLTPSIRFVVARGRAVAMALSGCPAFPSRRIPVHQPPVPIFWRGSHCVRLR